MVCLFMGVGPSSLVLETSLRNSVSHAFDRAVKLAGLHSDDADNVSFHTLRHTFASRLARAGVPLNTIRELLGHGSMTVVFRYSHLAPNNLREAVNLLSTGTSTVQKSVGERVAS